MIIQNPLAWQRDHRSCPAQSAGRVQLAWARAIGLSLVLFGSHLAGTPAWASAADICQPDPGCQIHSQQGVQLSVARDYAAALDEFRAAYAVKPEPRLLINIGRCLFRLGRPKEAEEQLRQFLLSEPNPDSEDKDKVNQYLADAQTAVTAGPGRASARVSIQGAAAGARVFTDGAEQGTVPLSAPLELAPGRHDLEIRGATTIHRHLDLTAGQDVTVVLAAPSPGRGHRPVWRIGLGAAGLAVGAAVLGAGTYLLLLNGKCAPGSQPTTCSTGFDDQGRLLTQMYATSGAGGAMVTLGAVAVVASIALLAVPGPRPRATVAATLLPGGGQLAAVGSF